MPNGNSNSASKTSKTHSNTNPTPNQRKKGKSKRNINVPSLGLSGPTIGSGPNKTLRIHHRSLGFPLVSTAAGAFTGPLPFSADPTGGIDPYIRALGGLYDRWRVHSLTIMYSSSVGTTRDGYIVIGFDTSYTATMIPQQISSLGVSTRVPIYKDTMLRVPLSLLRTQPFYACRYTSPTISAAMLREVSPGTIFIGGLAPNSLAFGEIWLEYDLEFSAPSGGAGVTFFLEDNSPPPLLNPVNFIPTSQSLLQRLGPKPN